MIEMADKSDMNGVNPEDFIALMKTLELIPDKDGQTK
jgi:hypothetical protein